MIQYHIAELNRLIKDIFDITGISISVLDLEKNRLVSISKPNDFCSLLQSIPGEHQKCKECDSCIIDKCSNSKRLEYHICRTGLCDCAMPTIKHDTLVGYIIMGRIRSAEVCSSLTYQPVTDTVTCEQLHARYKQVPVMTEQQLHGLYDLLPSVLFNNAIQVIYDPFINAVADFIRDNLQEKINIQKLCAQFHVSTNFLYQAFRSNFGCTVNEYIIEQRVKAAKNLLENADDPIYAIAEKVGIENYTYFCKLFKKKTGVTPMEYRKQLQPEL